MTWTSKKFWFVIFSAWAALALSAANVSASPISESFEGRDLIVYVPTHVSTLGQRSLVVVLHGGLGNASLIESGHAESGLGMDIQAEAHGFVVLYLNGTRAARGFGAANLAWNAGGGCCGLPAKTNVDDVQYIDHATQHVIEQYGVDRSRVFVMGHSNGAMMAQRLICESTTFAAAVAVSGPLNVPVSSCPAARGKRVLAIHGSADENVPVAGGQGTKGLAHIPFNSEELSREVFTNSGATYRLETVAGAPHKLDLIDAALKRTDGTSIAEQAVRFFGISPS